jgi:uncharacterized membrane protein YphA (DoxX/SURF4 family)
MNPRDPRRARMYWASIAVLILLVVGVCIPLGFATQQFVAFGVAQLVLCALWIAFFGKYRPRRGGD